MEKNNQKDISDKAKEYVVKSIEHDKVNLAKLDEQSIQLGIMFRRENLKRKYGFDITIADFLKELKFIAKNNIRTAVFFILVKSYFEKTWITFSNIQNSLNQIKDSKLAYHLNILLEKKMIERKEMIHKYEHKRPYVFYNVVERIAYIGFLLMEYIEHCDQIDIDKADTLKERPDILLEIAIQTAELIIKEQNTFERVMLITYMDVRNSFLQFRKEKELSYITKTPFSDRKKGYKDMKFKKNLEKGMKEIYEKHKQDNENDGVNQNDK